MQARTDSAVSKPISRVRKRDGQTLQEFDLKKIENAIRKAWIEAEGKADETQLEKVAHQVQATLTADLAEVEQIQDAVEVSLMRQKLFAVAKAYILYRQSHSEKRLSHKKPDPLAVSDYIHYSKYGRHREEFGRREMYAETVDRVESMHLRRYGHIPTMSEDIRWAFDLVREKALLPSMRSMQFGGAAIEANNCRMYNCSFSLVDRPRVFAEAMYLLLSGCGVGYSVQFEHVDKLPTLKFIDTKEVVHHIVEDSIEGWADALDALIESYITGYHLELSFHKIRPAGAKLKTSGGKAPGHLKLKEALEKIREVLHGAQGRKLRPVECHRIMCFAADAVLSGGIRRSAMIALFSLEDSEMMYIKTGNWFSKEPWLANANNSVAIKRDEIKKKQFKRIFQMTREWGDPGFNFCSSFDYGTNPCGEIGLNPQLVIDDRILELVYKKSKTGGSLLPDSIKAGETYTGWSFCNLCEINGSKLKTLEQFLMVAKAATIIGTCQAGYTYMPYLGWVSEMIAQREALLGIGMTGMLDSPQITCNPEYQREVAENIKKWNAEIATRIGIQPAARTTCVKPSGTTSLELGGVGSGHHAHHAKKYIRRVTADELETVFQAFQEINPHMCVRKPDGKWVIEFPVEAPEGAILKEDLTALGFLEMVRSTQVNWVLPGTANPESSPGLTHNVSNTVHVKPEEWDEVAEYLWTKREFFTGVTLLSERADKDFAFAPLEATITEADEARWNQLVHNYRPVNYAEIKEMDDSTDFSAEPACAGGACAIT